MTNLPSVNTITLAKTLMNEGITSFLEELNNQLDDFGYVSHCFLNGYIVTFGGGKASRIMWDEKLLASSNKLPSAMKIAEQFVSSVEWSYWFHFSEEDE